MFEDDRTEQERETHTVFYGGIDQFMSGWGKAPELSRAYWACRPEDADRVRRWVLSRGDIKKVGCPPSVHPPVHKDLNHTHVYVVRDGHRALMEENEKRHWTSEILGGPTKGSLLIACAKAYMRMYSELKTHRSDR